LHGNIKWNSCRGQYLPAEGTGKLSSYGSFPHNKTVLQSPGYITLSSEKEYLQIKALN
jgi:hypothetical protein